MRFVVLTQYFAPEIGAPSVRLRGVITELVNAGHEVEVVTSLPNYPTGRIFAAYRGRLYRSETLFGATVHRVWSYPAIGGGIRRLTNYLSFVLSSGYGLSKCRKPDYIFIESPPLFLGLAGLFAARCWRARAIFNVADLWPDSIKDMGAMQGGFAFRMLVRLEKWIYRKSDFVNAVTDGIRNTLIDEKGVPKTKVLFLPNGVDTNIFQPRPPDVDLRRELGLEGARVVLYAGTIGYAQGLTAVLSAMAELQKRASDITLLLIGAGSERKALEALAVEMGLTNVIFIDPKPLEYVARAYSFSEIGLASLIDIPLFNGARPSKVFPAMASGKPVIYFGRGEGARLIEGAQAGIVVSPGDSRKLALAFEELINNPNRARELGSSGHDFVSANLTWKAIVESWVASLHPSLRT